MSSPRGSVRGERSSGNRQTWVFAAKINVYALSLTALWTPLNSVLLARKVETIASASSQTSLLGLLTLLGIGLAALVQPIAGWLNDRSRLPRPRATFIVGGTLLGLPALAAIWWAPSFGWLLLGYAILQTCMNFAQAALQALIPEFIPHEARGTASGLKNAFDVLGGVIGLGATTLLIGVAVGAPLLFIAAALLTGAALTWIWVPRGPRRTSRSATSSRSPAPPAKFLSTSVRAFRAHPRFAWTVVLRFLFLLGFYPVQRFLLYDVETRFSLPNAAQVVSLAALGALLLAAASAVVAGALSDRVSRESILKASIFAEVVGLGGIALAPSLILLFIAGAILSVGGGAAQGVSWAILSDSMPRGRGATYFGLANLATAGASALAGLFGPLEAALSTIVGGSAFPVAYGIAAAIALTSLIPLGKVTS